MKTMKIFEPAMCCSTGVCGPSVDVDLLRITAVMNQLNKEEKRIERLNLTDHPLAFVENAKVNQLLNESDVEILPITLVNNEIVISGRYPSNEEIEKYLEVKLAEDVTEDVKEDSCGCGDGCC
jgi:hypothetical protein